ncbi:MAG: GNAT family N-acetyltransferase [Paludibacter sp.]|nr:GNAT family N-acetyltransferase [Paludibacter sp.]
MEDVLAPIDVLLLKRELTKSRFLRPTNKAHNEIYIVDAYHCPNVMLEIGRLRELSFRAWGGGSGRQSDTDLYDYLPKPYSQLIVWNPDNEEIIGGYRFICGKDVEFDQNGQPHITMEHLFRFSEQFITGFLPQTIELGRAFVQPKYQSSQMGMKSLFALDNLWDGLGALTHLYSDTKYFIGKVTIYNDFSSQSRELIIAYLRRYCPDPDRFIYTKKQIRISEETQKKAKEIFRKKNSREAYKILQRAIRADNQTIPPLINAYIGLTETMRSFGTMYDPDFGSVFETGIMITIPDLLESKRQRYIEPYINYLRIILEEKKRQIASRRARQNEIFKRNERANKYKK